MVRQLVLGVAATLVLVRFAVAEEVDSVIDDRTRFATKAANSPEKINYGKLYLDSKGRVHTQVNREGRVTKDTKVALGTFDENKNQWAPGEAIEGGVAADIFKDTGKVLRVRVTLGEENRFAEAGFLGAAGDAPFAAGRPPARQTERKSTPETSWSMRGYFLQTTCERNGGEEMRAPR